MMNYGKKTSFSEKVCGTMETDKGKIARETSL